MLESFHFVNTSSPATARVMPFRLPLLTSVILWAGLCSQASALTLGPVRALAYLGQPLDATIVVQLGPGETLSDRCVGATVTAGETVVPADQITTTFVAPPGFEARIRVRTWVPVDEPVVMVQVTAAALTSELKSLCHAASADTIPTSASKEDHVSMSMGAALKAERALELARTVLAIELLCACQAIDLRAPLVSSAMLMAAHAAVRAHVPTLTDDRPPAPDIVVVARTITSGALERSVGMAVN